MFVKAILIDPFACTVTAVDVDAENYRTLYPLLSHPSMEVDTFDRCYFDGLAGRDALFFDDEGLMKPCARFFQLVSLTNRAPLVGPLAGKGLIVGADAEGETAAAATPLDYVSARAVFLHHFDDRKLMRVREPFDPFLAANVPGYIPDSSVM
jgi:hypothetical protein